MFFGVVQSTIHSIALNQIGLRRTDRVSITETIHQNFVGQSYWVRTRSGYLFIYLLLFCGSFRARLVPALSLMFPSSTFSFPDIIINVDISCWPSLYRMTRMGDKFRIIWRLPITSQKTSVTFVSSYFYLSAGDMKYHRGWVGKRRSGILFVLKCVDRCKYVIKEVRLIVVSPGCMPLDYFRPVRF